MTTVEETIARNTKKLEAFIDGDGESVAIGGIVIIRVDGWGYKFRIKVGDGLQVYADEIEIDISFAYLKNKGIIGAFLYLGDE